MPRNDRLSNSTPCCGTSFASMPSRVPSQNTLAPRAASLAATASPGKTCPPVPPVVIMIVTNGPPRLRLTPQRCPHRQPAVARLGAVRRRSCSYGVAAQQPAILVIDAQHDCKRDAVGDDAAAAERQQRQREALGRQ